jgi:hypothetical protein
MKHLNDYTQEAQTELFNKTGSFFAFSKSQFDKAKKEGVKYSSLGGGLICPKDNVKELTEGLESGHQIGLELDVKENGAANIIEREYFNYESQVSGDTSDVLDALSAYKEKYPELFTKDLIDNTFIKCFNLAIEKDWF